MKTRARKPIRQQDPIRIFYSYSHLDKRLRGDLESHLALLKGQGLIESWYDRNISPGRDWEVVISENLESADLILLLISKNFVASQFCRDETTAALERHRLGDARVIPIMIESVLWTTVPIEDLNARAREEIKKIQAIPSDDPIKSKRWKNNLDEAWTHVATGIGKVIDELIVERQRDIKVLEKHKPEIFRKRTLSMEDMRTGAQILCNLVERRDNFDPDLLIAANQGGMVTAAAMNKHWRKPVGVVYSAVKGGRRVIKYVSLPYEVASSEESRGGRRKLKPRGVLVVDTKLKTAESADGIQAVLRAEYGENVEIRYAIILAYGGWKPSRWRVDRSAAFTWPIQFRPKSLKAYVAYCTDVDPQDDRIEEEVRPGSRNL